MLCPKVLIIILSLSIHQFFIIRFTIIFDKPTLWTSIEQCWVQDQSRSWHFLVLVLILILRYVQSLWDFHYCAWSWSRHLWSWTKHCYWAFFFLPFMWNIFSAGSEAQPRTCDFLLMFYLNCWSLSVLLVALRQKLFWSFQRRCMHWSH